MNDVIVEIFLFFRLFTAFIEVFEFNRISISLDTNLSFCFATSNDEIKYWVIPSKLSIMLINKSIFKESSIEPICSWNVDIPIVLFSNETIDEFPFQASKIK